MMISQEIKKSFTLATHQLVSMYPLVKDPKVLVSSLKSIHRVHDLMLTTLLKNKPGVPQRPTFIVKLQWCNDVFSEDEQKLMLGVYELLQAFQTSSIIFPREDTLVMCSDEYDMRTVTLDDMKVYLTQTRKIMQKVNIHD